MIVTGFVAGYAAQSPLDEGLELKLFWLAAIAQFQMTDVSCATGLFGVMASYSRNT